MDRIAILESITGHLSKALELDQSEIHESSTLVEDLDADSLDVLELVLVMKSEFGITVNDGEVKYLLAELAQFLPEPNVAHGDLTDEELARIARSLTVGTIVDFIDNRMEDTG